MALVGKNSYNKANKASYGGKIITPLEKRTESTLYTVSHYYSDQNHYSPQVFCAFYFFKERGYATLDDKITIDYYENQAL